MAANTLALIDQKSVIGHNNFHHGDTETRRTKRLSVSVSQ
jgi:hypothetical protein